VFLEYLLAHSYARDSASVPATGSEKKWEMKSVLARVPEMVQAPAPHWAADLVVARSGRYPHHDAAQIRWMRRRERRPEKGWRAA
jgi:hypothetical protein